MTSFYEELHKTNKISDKKENAQSRANVDKWIFRLLLLLIGIMPLIVLAYSEEVVSPLISNIDVLSSGSKGDLFTHYKALFVLAITVITGAMLLAKVFFMDGKIRKTPLNYAIGLFAFALIVSTIFSPNITVALNGQFNRSDGAISWLSYLALMFIAMNIEYPKKVVDYVVYTMMPFVFINLFIITMNFYGKDLLQNGWMQNLVSITLPEGAKISEGSHLVGTLNQWNFMSGMFAMMAVMYLAWAIMQTTWIKISAGVATSIVALAVMWMSLSTSGFLTVAVMMLATLVLVIKVPSKPRAIIAILAFVCISSLVFHILAEENERVWTESFGFVIEKNPYAKQQSGLTFFENKVYASEEVLSLPILPGRELAFGTGRGYIWGKTYDMVKDRAILGYGQDTIVYNFPHYNLDARSGLFDENTIVDKPHNTFMGIFYGTGVLGLIAILFIGVFLFVGAIKTFMKNNTSVIILAITFLAYILQAMFNDSLPGTTSIAFIMAGIFIALTTPKNSMN